MKDIVQEEFEVIEFLGQRMLFTNERLAPQDVPYGLHVAHLRHSDDGDRFCTVERHVLVNHGGSIISKQPLPYDGEYIMFTDDNALNFLGEDMTLREFIEE